MEFDILDSLEDVGKFRFSAVMPADQSGRAV
jgi:hypothetical protein